MDSNPRPRWYQFSVLNFLALITIISIVPIAGYAWLQRRQAVEAMALGRQATARSEQAMELSHALAVENRILCSLAGVDTLSQAERASLEPLVKDDPKMQAILKQYEAAQAAVELATGEPLAPDLRDYPSILTLLAQHLKDRRERLLEAEDVEQSLSEELHRIRLQAEVYKAQSEQLEEERPEPRTP